VAAKRRGRPRGLDFYVKWSAGNWAELVALRFCREALSEGLGVTAFRYGYSSGRIAHSLEEFREIEREKEELEKFGKRPNLLLYDQRFAEEHCRELEELVRRPDEEVAQLVGSALAAAEVEMSLWSVKRAKKLCFTVKEEDFAPCGAGGRDSGSPYSSYRCSSTSCISRP
jgi:NifB/MoaA-like Fe-S oxidoreductase